MLKFHFPASLLNEENAYLYIMSKKMTDNQHRRLGFNYIPYIMFTAAIVFFFIYRHSKKDFELLERSGIVIVGTITEKDISSSDDYGDKYYLTYEYTHRDKVYQNENKVYQKLYDLKEIKDTIQVRMLLEDPKNSKIYSNMVFPEDEEYLLLTIILFLTGLIFIIIPNFKNIINFFKKDMKPK